MENVLPSVLSVSAAFGAACAVGWMLRCAHRRGGVAGHLPAEGELRSHILWGSFYVNPNDPRGWIPRPNGMGITPNFRTRRSVVVFVALLLFTALSAFALVFVVLA